MFFARTSLFEKRGNLRNRPRKHCRVSGVFARTASASLHPPQAALRLRARALHLKTSCFALAKKQNMFKLLLREPSFSLTRYIALLFRLAGSNLKLLLREPSFVLTRSPALCSCFARGFSETPFSKDQFLCAKSEIKPFTQATRFCTQ